MSIPQVIARLLVDRGIDDVARATSFLRPALDQLHSPYQMLGMREAVDRLERAISAKEKMLIYGDYDVDGTMATVILKTVIELCGGVCDFHVPHRLLEGYGMRDEVIERAASEGVTLIISVDTGIRAFAAAETAERVGVDLIVTDHHLPQGSGVPKALAVLNPNQAGCTYPCKDLCGAGVAFKVAQALLERQGKQRLIPSFLKVVAIATIADAVPLIGENRVFAALGLQGLQRPVNPGLKALMRLSELTHGRPLTSTEVAFRIAPRMNAAGRMDVARDVVELFTVKDLARAEELATKLNDLNTARQQEEKRITEEIERRIEEDPALRDAHCMVIDGEEWHRGVIGICASRVVDKFARPALVISRDGEEAHGSGRSIHCFHLLQALETAPELFLRFGGHAHAVGFAMRSERIPELRRRLEQFAAEKLNSADLERQLEYDAVLELDEVTPRFWEALSSLQPFGMGNPEPVFAARGAKVMAEPKIMREKHLKLKLRRYTGGSSGALSRGIDALGWRMAHRLESEPILGGEDVDIAFRLEQNMHPEFGGALQLVLCDFRKAESALAGEA